MFWILPELKSLLESLRSEKLFEMKLPPGILSSVPASLNRWNSNFLSILIKQKAGLNIGKKLDLIFGSPLAFQKKISVFERKIKTSLPTMLKRVKEASILSTDFLLQILILENSKESLTVPTLT